MEVKLKMDQQTELQEKMLQFEQDLPDKLKMSTNLLNKKMIYEKAIKQKEYYIICSTYIIFKYSQKTI